MERIENAIGAMPLRRDVVQKAFERFQKTGELPEEHRLAAAVVQQALRGGVEGPTAAPRSGVLVVSPEDLERMQRSRGVEPGPEGPSVRECVFDEAVYATGIVRFGARQALKLFVSIMEGDVTDPQFLADQTLPDHAGVGLHLMGFPESLAKPPYVAQARRLFARFADLRERVDQDDPAWFDRFEAAIVAFHECGELPQDDVLLDTVLADAEFRGLCRHGVGEDVSELMGVLDKVQGITGSQREAALAEVVAVVTSSRASQT